MAGAYRPHVGDATLWRYSLPRPERARNHTSPAIQ